MKIRSIEINQFMKFDTHQVLRGLDDGLNLVVGPNEMGKSTLLTALRAAFFDRYRSQAQKIKGFQNSRNQAAPVVHVRFELDDGMYTIKKRFIKRPYAELVCPDGRILQSDVVETELNRLLRAEGGKLSPDAPGMWGVLWVEQGQSFIAPKLSESAISNLHSALEAEVGTVLGGRRGQELPSLFESELNELVTPKLKSPKGEYARTIKVAENLEAEISSLKNRSNELSQDLAELEQKEKKLQDLKREDVEKRDEKKLTEARQRKVELEKHAERRKAAVSEGSRLKSELKLLENSKEEHRRLTNSISEKTERIDASEKSLFVLKEKLSVLENQRQTLNADVETSQNAIDELNEKRRQANLSLEIVRKEQEILKLKTTFEAVKSFEDRYQNDRKAASEILVTEDAIKTIRKANQRYETAKSVLGASATTISFLLREGGADGVKVNSKLLQDSLAKIQAVKRTVITIPNRGEIEIEPGIQDSDALVKNEKIARKFLSRQLEQVQADSLDHAETLFAKRRLLLDWAALAKAESKGILTEFEGQFNNFHELADHIAKLENDLIAKIRQLNMESHLTLLDATTVIEQVERMLDRSIQKRDESYRKLNRCRDQITEIKTDIARDETMLNEYGAQSKRDTDLLEQLQSKNPLGILNTKINDAMESLSQQSALVEKLDLEHSPSSLEHLSERIQRFERKMSARQEKINYLGSSIERLKGRIEEREALGIDEKIGKLEQELDQNRTRVEQFEFNRKVLELLVTTLRGAEQTAKQRFLQPVIDRVNPYLQYMFKDSTLNIDENLNILEIVRDEFQEKFQQLSTGTQEQISVLIRLAFAELLADRNVPVTVVLDDALVYSDDDRMDKMFDILNTVAKNIQIIVLTCRENLFEGLTEQVLSLEQGEGERLQSA